jgi:hypothetical protein
MLIARLRNKKIIFIVVLISILIVSVVLNLYDNLYVIPVMQTRINYMSAEAFQAWLDELKSLKAILEPAKTNLDVKEAMNHTYAATRFAEILEWQIEISRPPNFAEHLYLRISTATLVLDQVVSAIATKPPVTLRNLDDNTLQKIRNLTMNIENIVSSVGTVDTGVNPVQQLEEKGVLNQVKNYLRQIVTTYTGS